MSRSAIKAAGLMLWSGAAMAQGVGGGSQIDNKGECNANVGGGSGNTIIINCNTNGNGSGGGSTTTDPDVLVVLTADNFPTVVTWQSDMWGNIIPFNFFPGVVNLYNSTFSMTIGEERSSYSISQNFPGNSFRIAPGDHPYSMQVQLVYANGMSVQTQCNGIVDLRSSATLIPRMNIQVDPNFGQIAPMGCTFTARPN